MAYKNGNEQEATERIEQLKEILISKLNQLGTMEKINADRMDKTQKLRLETSHSNNKYEPISNWVDAILKRINAPLRDGVNLNNVAEAYSATCDIDFQDLIMRYSEESLKEIKEELHRRVRNAMGNCIEKFFEKEMAGIEAQKDTLWQRITGKNPLKDARLINCEARKQFALAKSKSDNQEHGVRDMLKEMYDCAEQYSDGVLTPTMAMIEEDMTCFRFGRDKKTIKELSIYKVFHNKELQQGQTQEGLQKANNLPTTIRKDQKISKKKKKQNEIKALCTEANELIKETQELKRQSGSKSTNSYTSAWNSIYMALSRVYTSLGKYIEQTRETPLSELGERNQ